jgi:hypothetical protein
LSLFQHKRRGVAGQIFVEDLERPNVDRFLEFSIQRVRVRWKMVTKMLLNQDSVKSADGSSAAKASAARSQQPISMGARAERATLLGYF